MYTFTSRIRYSETDINEKLTLASMLDYFQDCSTFQSEDLGVGMQYLRERNMIWVLSSWQVEVERFPMLLEQVKVGTFPYDFKKCFGYRNFFMQDADGHCLARANTLWTLLYTENFKPAEPPEDMIAKYEMQDKLEMHYAKRKITVPANGEVQGCIQIMPWHLDANHHVNNVQYVRMASAFIPEDFQVKHMRAEYKKQAYLGNVLHAFVAWLHDEENMDTYVISLQDEEGKAFANVEFAGQKRTERKGTESV